VTDPDLEKRLQGLEQTGLVTLRDFDRGVAITLRTVIEDGLCLLKLPNIDPPPGMSGIPVYMSSPEEMLAKKKLPCVVIQRDSISPAMARWQGVGHQQYNAPALGALPLQLTAPDGSILTGYNAKEVMGQAMPYDIGYTISIFSFGREAQNRLHANRILDHILRVYTPYSVVYLADSIGDTRTYQAYMEGVSVNDRAIGFAVTLRVEAELDSLDSEVQKTVYSGITLNTTSKKV
jgi:hypothetical protein